MVMEVPTTAAIIIVNIDGCLEGKDPGEVLFFFTLIMIITN
jgi:hypothetical protein